MQGFPDTDFFKLKIKKEKEREMWDDHFCVGRKTEVQDMASSQPVDPHTWGVAQETWSQARLPSWCP